MNNKKIGHDAEDQACTYLKGQGLKLIERNYFCKLGEIDLIMRNRTHLIFVEVRYRTSTLYGNTAESVTRQKQRKLIKTAKYYFLQNKISENIDCRFDVVALTAKGYQTDILWIKDAFQVQ